MYLENLVADARDPHALGRFWEAALGTETLTDDAGGYETRLAVPDGPVFDLCFQPVAEPDRGHRLRPVVAGGAEPEATVRRLVGLGARRTADAEVLTDPEGTPFRVLAGEGPSPLAALVLEVADPARERDFWAWLTGWLPQGESGLRHSSGRGFALELVAEETAKEQGKNPLHLDVRLEPGEDADAVARAIEDRGGRELHLGWGDLPWRHFADPSGNEFCVLPVPKGS